MKFTASDQWRTYSTWTCLAKPTFKIRFDRGFIFKFIKWELQNFPEGRNSARNLNIIAKFRDNFKRNDLPALRELSLQGSRKPYKSQTQLPLTRKLITQWRWWNVINHHPPATLIATTESSFTAVWQRNDRGSRNSPKVQHVLNQ